MPKHGIGLSTRWTLFQVRPMLWHRRWRHFVSTQEQSGSVHAAAERFGAMCFSRPAAHDRKEIRKRRTAPQGQSAAVQRRVGRIRALWLQELSTDSANGAGNEHGVPIFNAESPPAHARR